MLDAEQRYAATQRNIPKAVSVLSLHFPLFATDSGFERFVTAVKRGDLAQATGLVASDFRFPAKHSRALIEGMSGVFRRHREKPQMRPDPESWVWARALRLGSAPHCAHQSGGTNPALGPYRRTPMSRSTSWTPDARRALWLRLAALDRTQRSPGWGRQGDTHEASFPAMSATSISTLR